MGCLSTLFCLHLVQHYVMEWNVTFCCDVVWYGTVCKCPKLSHTVFWRGAMVAMTPFFLIFWTSAINSQVQRIASVLEWYTPRRLMLKTFQSKELLCGILHGSKAWYGNAVEQLPNIERTHSKAIRLKMFLFFCTIACKLAISTYDVGTSGLISQEYPGQKLW